ncbi:hypothetical protein EJB05_18137, partial [Eragrostis curvula]
MATEPLLPLVPRHRRGLAVVVAAAAPLLVFLAAFPCSPATVSSTELVELTLLTSAREKGAVCLDGSPPGYHLQRGFGSGAHNWLVYLQDGTKLFYRGLRIWEAVIDELMGQGMATAKQALLTGCSAGGLSALMHCDNFHARFAQGVSVKCLSDAGFFVDEKDLSGERSMRSLCSGVVHLQNVREALPKDCLAKKDPTECFFPAELTKSISTPTFILNPDYDSWQIRNVLAPNGSYPGQSWSNCKADIRNCSSSQIDVLHGFRKKIISKLQVAEEKKDWGLFIDSCFTHCQTPFRISWNSRISPRLDNKTIAEAVGDWYFGRTEKIKRIDCEYPYRQRRHIRARFQPILRLKSRLEANSRVLSATAHATAMATELRAPLAPQNRPRHDVEAMAPLLMLLAMAAFSCSPMAVATASPEPVELTLLHSAVEKGAVCLDGSPPAYQLQRGFGSGAHSWLVYLAGGAWCNSTETCSERKVTDLGSSHFMKEFAFDGILSNKHPINPDFYNWNKVFIRYCDGASFAGDAEVEDQDGSKLFFRGLRIWEVVIDELMRIGLADAKQTLLLGCSSGGLATLLHCDNFRARFPQEVAVKCLSDAGFFLDIKDLSGERSFRSLCEGVVQLQNVRKVLPKDCLAKKDPTECFFPAELIKSISTPTFILNSAYDSWQIRNVLAPNGSYPGDSWSSCKDNIRNCSTSQIDVLHGFRRKLVSDLRAVRGTGGCSSIPASPTVKRMSTSHGIPRSRQYLAARLSQRQ